MKISGNSSPSQTVFNLDHTEKSKTKKPSIIPSSQKPSKTKGVIQRNIKAQNLSKNNQKAQQPVFNNNNQDISSYLIKHHCEKENLAEASFIFNRMVQNNTPPSFEIAANLINLLVNFKKFTEAENVAGKWEELDQKHNKTDTQDSKRKLQFELLISYLDTNHIEEARKFLESLRASEVQCPQTIYLRFLDKYIKENSVEAVKIVSKEYLGTLSEKKTEECIAYCKQNNLMDAEGFLQRFHSIEKNRSLLILQILVERCIGQQDWTHADLILQEIKRNHCSSYLLHTLILHRFKHHFDQNEFDQCEVVLRALKYRTIEKSPLSDWLKDYCLNEQSEKAEKMLDLLYSVEVQIEVGHCQPLISHYIYNKKWEQLDLLFEKVNTKNKGSILALHPFLMTCFAAQEVEKAKEIYDRICNCSKPSKATYDILIEGFLENDCLNDIEAVIDVMRKKNVQYNAVIFASLIKVYSKYEDIDKVDMLYKRMLKRKIEPDEGTYKSLLLAYCKSGCVEKAEKLWQRINKGKTLYDAQFYQILFECFCKYGELQKAYDLLEIMKSRNIEPDIYFYNSLLEGHLFLDQYEEACKVQKEMESKNFNLNAFSYNYFFAYYCRKGQIEKAEALFEMMEQNDVVPIRICFVHFVKHYCFTGYFEKAFETLKKMQKHGFQPDIDLMNDFIKGYVLRGKPKTAHEVLQDLSSYGLFPSSYSYHTVIEGFLDSGQFSHALEIMNEMWGAKLICKVYYLNRLIQGLINVGQEQKAEELFYRLFNLNPQPNQATYSILIGHYFITGQFEKIEKLIGMMAKNGLQPTAETMSRLINGYVHKQEWQRVEVVLELAEEMNFSLNPWIYFTFIQNYAKDNAFDRIAQLLNSLEKRFPDESPKIYQEIFILFCLEDKLKEEGCKKLVVSWLKKNKIPSSPELNLRLIEGYWAKGDINHAQFLESKMTKPSSLENKSKEHVFRAPEKEEIQVIVEGKFRDKKKLDYNEYFLLLSDHCKNQEFEDAELLLEEMRKNGLAPKEDILFVLVSTYLKAKQITNAQRCRAEMSRKDGIVPSILVGNLFIEAYFQAGKRLSAEKEMKEWEKVANFETYSILIREYCRLGYINKAEQILSKREKDKPLLDDVYIGALLEKKHYEKAVEFFDTLKIDIKTEDRKGISVKDCRSLSKWQILAFVYKEIKNKNNFHFYLSEDRATQVLKMVDSEFPNLYPKLNGDYLTLESWVSTVKKTKQSENLNTSIQ